MRNRIALAYGFGRESRILLDKLKKSNPLLIICIGEKGEGRLDLLNSEIKTLQKKYRVKILKIKGVTSVEGFQENWDFFELKGKIKVEKYSNTILEYFAKRKKPFDTLYVGRRRRDFKDRKILMENLPRKIQIDGIRFPLWNER